MGDFDFRLRQSLSDLHRVPGVAAVQEPSTVLFGSDAKSDKRWAALARAIADSLETEAVDPFLADMWEANVHLVRKAPAAIRAALMNGICAMRTWNLGEGIDPPSCEELVTFSMQPVASALIRIGRQMTVEEMGHVARADRGCDVARHRAALEVLLEEPGLAYPDGEFWYPAEVVELVSHVPGMPGYVPCLAIVLLAALRNGDAQTDGQHRLAQQSDAIAALAPEVREPFFAAFRHLYESIPEWSPAVKPSFTLPWVSLP